MQIPQKDIDAAKRMPKYTNLDWAKRVALRNKRTGIAGLPAHK